jgi:hypothetical protein
LRGGEVSRALPEEWIPLMMIAYEELKNITGRMGVDVVLAGAGACSVHVEVDSTKDVDFILSKPLDVKMLVEMLEELAERLEIRGFNVIGRRLQQSRAPEDWVIQIFIAINLGRIIGIKVFNLLAVRPLSLYEATVVEVEELPVKTLTLESWIAKAGRDPNGVDEHNLRRLEKAVERGFDRVRLLEILRRLGMGETIKVNARDVLEWFDSCYFLLLYFFDHILWCYL